jgi:DNA-directed RNA polymerase subunit beta
VVINAKVFSRKGVDKDERSQQIEDEEEARLLKDQNDEIRIIRDSGRRKIERCSTVVRPAPSGRLVDDKGKGPQEGPDGRPGVLRGAREVLRGDQGR